MAVIKSSSSSAQFFRRVSLQSLLDFDDGVAKVRCRRLRNFFIDKTIDIKASFYSLPSLFLVVFDECPQLRPSRTSSGGRTLAVAPCSANLRSKKAILTGPSR